MFFCGSIRAFMEQINNDLTKFNKMSQTPDFKRSLGLIDATMIVAGSMIGSGIFIVSADISRSVGSAGWLLFLWVLTGVITTFAALSYGELAGMMPKAGGQFVYIQRAWGDFTAFLYGWSVFTVTQTGLIAAVAVAFAKYLAVFFPSCSPANIIFTLGALKISAAQIVAILCVILLTFINSRGIQNGKWIQLVFTSAKLLALFLLILIGLFVGLQSGILKQNMQDFWKPMEAVQEGGKFTGLMKPLGTFGLIIALGTTIIGPLFSSDAWNNVTFIAGEIKDPKRNIPRSLLLGTTIVTILYIMTNISYLSLIPLKGSPTGTDALSQGIMFAANDRVATGAAAMIFGDTSVKIMAILIIISTFGCISGLVLAGARVYYAMAKDGLFFKQAGELNDAGVPGKALWLQCFWSSILCLSGSYGALLDYLIFTALIFYIITIVGIFILRKTEPDAERPYRVLGYPFIPILYIFFASAISLILLYSKTMNAGMGLLIVLLGIPFYYLMKKQA
jgi:basic amino acid/polyamine antiporter, APA family